MFLQEHIYTFCPDLAQKRVTLIILLLFVQFAIFFNTKQQLRELLPGVAMLNST
jgi:hypothetical protein